MNKKKVLVVMLGIFMIVGVATSFAYFTSKVNITDDGANGSLQRIKITNGNIIVKAEINNGDSPCYQWFYDVARHSGATADRDASPDINAAIKEPDGRAKIGSPVKTPVLYTRPGDALVLGIPNENGDGTGLHIKNESNITVKMRLLVKNDAAAKKEMSKLLDAGWQLYVNNENIDLANTLAIDLGTLKKSNTKDVDVRFELPLSAGDIYQGKSTLMENSSIDFNKILELQATQENNPGWTEDGR